ncbi:PREDICTED: subtilisin-like protease SBT5.3 [Erythranthe guttata]|uniref:subtilisin-like protease SBT5.3 n=1 Tax=Erythranthe guttata TaxID=4155 RepID=UPI00064DB90E|nr:PREDICTED: subtilisin-like protease SBT5.3 [Erythranthe guttata]|eukprot:XP_012848488.1 PREDICTED: subtilisin-like protease SBT5.3 [Erythranthe guttata]
MDGVISVFHSDPTESRPHTTRSWDFISLLEANWDVTRANSREQLLNQAGYGQNVVIGVLDSGIWPESESFNDLGMGPIPATWKGFCEPGVDFNSSHCNRKLIGARYYLKGFEANFGPLDPTIDVRSAREIDGHGTHTASTAGGRNVPGAAYTLNTAAIGGFGVGNATGGAPLARLAMYKVCWNIPAAQGGGSTCLDDDMLAAFDDAINDGVDVISVSIGGKTGKPYAESGIAVGALHAVSRNIVVVCSAGNSGPDSFTVTNISPWIITVGASSIDRVFSSPVVLGNGMVVEVRLFIYIHIHIYRNEIIKQGQSITPFVKGTYPLVYASDVEIPGTTTDDTSGLCLAGTLSPALTVGKAVFCWSGGTRQALEVQRAGGVAVVLGNNHDGVGVSSRPFLIPGTVILSDGKLSVYEYTQTDLAPTATLTPAITLIGGTTSTPTPFMAPFTSRGPNVIEPNILKPDITAPGFNILAAWSEVSSPFGVPTDNRVAKFNIISGTSMSCPHVAGVAALLKAVHPDWSSAAIRSALMTTATANNNLGKLITDVEGNYATPLQFGAGHIQPAKAADPGLVYDASYEDYLLFLCSTTGNLLDPTFACPLILPSPSNFNYPSVTITKLTGVVTVQRTLTNVGVGNATYTVTVATPPGFSVTISPATLFFSATGEKQSFSITVQATEIAPVDAFGWFYWSDEIHQVVSPILLSV